MRKRRGKSAAFLKKLRRKYGLGEFRKKRKKKRAKGKLGYPGNTAKERRSIGVPEIGNDQ